MTSDEFRSLFNRDRFMMVKLIDGTHAYALGLNGDNVRLRGGKEVPLESFEPDRVTEGITQLAAEGRPSR